MPETMRAAYLEGHEGIGSLTVGRRRKPEPGHGEVLIRIAAAGLNRVDLYMANDGSGFRHGLPLTLGVDGAGVIEALGPRLHRAQRRRTGGHLPGALRARRIHPARRPDAVLFPRHSRREYRRLLCRVYRDAGGLRLPDRRRFRLPGSGRAADRLPHRLARGDDGGPGALGGLGADPRRGRRRLDGGPAILRPAPGQDHRNLLVGRQAGGG